MAESIAFNLADGVIGKLGSLAFQRIALWWNLKDDLDDLKSIVSTVKAVLLDAEEKSVTSHGVKDWLEKLKDALYDADDLLDDFSIEAQRQDVMSGNKLTKKVRIFFSSSNQFAYGLKIGGKIKAIKARFDSIERESRMLQLVVRDRPVEAPFMAKRRQQGHSFVTKGEIIGRDDDKKALLELMLESEEDFLIVSIVGIGGLGKTALAQLVYNDIDKDKAHFELKMWVCVSDVFDVKVIVQNIIKSATNCAPDANLEMDQLQKQLRDSINGKKYLLVLDDIWNEEREDWFALKKLLMGGAKGSRIIVTTRSRIVAKITGSCLPHVLKGLSVDDAWTLFKEIAFEQRRADSENLSFVEIGKEVLEKCGGVPLVIRTIAATLSLKETDSEWLFFKDNELGRVSQKEGEILPTLKLSYDHLPSNLKHCFAYSRLFPKDYKIHVQRLVHLWIAQGFVKQSNPHESLEAIGFGYFKDLVDRSFFQEVEGEYLWGYMTCKMHDLMHDLAEFVAGTESTILDSSNSSTRAVMSEKCRHVSGYSSLILSNEITDDYPLFKAKKLRTLLCLPGGERSDMSNETWGTIISSFRRLRVLTLADVNLNTVPRCIDKLKHLRYLDLSANSALKTLPEGICRIQKLQTLNFHSCWRLEKLPENIEKLVNLTHVRIERCEGLTHMPRGIGKLTRLETLSQFVVDEHGSRGADVSELNGLNKLRGGLKIRNLGYVRNKLASAILKEKAHLESLSLEWSRDEENEGNKSLEDLQPHPNLKDFFLSGWRGDARFPSWFSLLSNLTSFTIDGPSRFKSLPTFHQLPHLLFLHIDQLSELEYMEDAEGRQGEAELFFPSLIRISLSNCPKLKSWWRNKDDDGTTTRTIIPRLSSLYIQDCPLLTSMPLYPSLERGLELRNCSLRPLQQTIELQTTDSLLPLSKLESFQLVNREGEGVVDARLVDKCLQNMTSFEDLSISSSHWVKSLSGSLQHLSGLKSLTIRDNEEFDLDGTQMQFLRNLSSLELENIPHLVSLPSWLQNLTQLVKLTICGCDGLTSLFPAFQHLTSLQSLGIYECKELDLSAPDTDTHTQIFQDSTSLQDIRLRNIPKCSHLPEWLLNLSNLKSLSLFDLPNLASLPDEMRRLTDLKSLYIEYVPQLSERCEKDIGADWPKIAHIPSIRIDGRWVQLTTL